MPVSTETLAQRLIAEADRETEKENAAYKEAVRKRTEEAAARRTARSSILQRALARLKEETDAALADIQRRLDEELEDLYADAEGDAPGPSPGIDPDDAPYEVDYTLPMGERYKAVRAYYLGYDDMKEAVADYGEDEIAKDYLGEYYGYLMQLLMTLA